MMIKRHIWFLLGACSIWLGCSDSEDHCGPRMMRQGDIELHIQPYSVTDMIGKELKEGLISKGDLEVRRKELNKHMHLRIKIMSTTSFDQAKRRYLDHDFTDDIKASVGQTDAHQSLFINETSFSGGNLVQYFLAYESDHQDEENRIDINIQSSVLGLDQELFSFDISCFQ